jgi:hypothetical protein
MKSIYKNTISGVKGRCSCIQWKALFRFSYFPAETSKDISVKKKSIFVEFRRALPAGHENSHNG